MQSYAGLVARAAALVIVAGPALCGDWYVDAVNGSDGNLGNSPAAPWRTLTHARASVPIGAAQTIHVAPGVYQPANGELFPIDVPPKFRFVGAGPTTIVRGSGATLFEFRSSISGNGWPIEPSSTLEALRLESAANGVSIISDWNSVRPSLRDLEISGMTTFGISVVSANAMALPIVSTTIERVAVEGCPVGLYVSTYAPSAFPLTVSDSRFEANGVGVRFQQFYAGNALLERCRVVGNSATGVECAGGNWGGLQLEVHDSLIAGNANHGVLQRFSGLGGGTACFVALRASTLASNGVGLRLANAQNGAELRGAIVASNGDDLDVVAALSNVSVSHTLIEDGDYSNVPSNLSGDPQFVNPAGGDWRLLWDSPCIDVSGSTSTASPSDLAGNPRVTDGDLDTLEVTDLGAFEFAPLHHAGSARVGTPLVLECWGPSGATCSVYFSRRALSPAPQSTPFGHFDLSPSQYGFFKATQTNGPTPALVQRGIPNHPALVGSTFSFQALTGSAGAPAGAAYSNPVVVTIRP